LSVEEYVMKSKIADWLTQRTTWMAFGSAAVTILAYCRPEWVGVAAGVLSAFGLVARDRRG
jgi:hypothetical protein